MLILKDPNPYNIGHFNILKNHFQQNLISQESYPDRIVSIDPNP